MQFSCKVLPTVFKALGLITNTTKKKKKKATMQNYHGQTEKEEVLPLATEGSDWLQSQNTKSPLFHYPFLLFIDKCSTCRLPISFH